jgi:hypothetical protein
MPHYSYIVVEGPHDVEFIARLLRVHGFHRVQYLRNLDPFWVQSGIIPNKFPFNDDLLKRVPVPIFFQTATHSIAIHSASGYTRIAETIQETFKIINKPETIESVGIILDADVEETVARRFGRMLDELREKNPGLVFPDMPGLIADNHPATGIYILPDNHSAGTLENILLMAAAENYANLHAASEQYIHSIDCAQLNSQELEDFHKPAGPNKAQVGSIASILKPGKAIQVSIQDNRWIEGEALNLPVIRAISSFLNQLLHLEGNGN